MSNALYYEDCALNYTQSPLDDSITSGCKGWSSAKIQGEMDTAHCDINNTIQSCYDATLSCINSSVSSINTDLSNKYAVCCNPTVKIGLASCVGNYGIAIGCGAGSYSSNYQYTIAVGTNARALGNYGVAIGYQASSSFTGANNLAIGTYAMYGASGATGCNNTAIGYNALRNIRGTANNDNTAIGSSALQAMTTGLYNTAIGSRALCGLTTGCENFGLGIDTGWAITTGCNNTLIGNNTGMGITENSSENTLIGKNIACASSGALCEATIIGSKASPSVTGIGNTAIGYCALPSLTTGIGNTGVGRYVGNALTTGSYNTVLGYEAKTYLPATNYGVALGYNAIAGNESISVGANSCTVGGAGQAIGSSSYAQNYATAIGLNACAGISSVSIGPNANNVLSGSECYAVSIGNGTYACSYGVALGNGAKVGCFSTAIGVGSCAPADFGIAIGCSARAVCCTQGIAIGYQSYNNGIESLAIGAKACTIGAQALSIGYCARACGDASISIGRCALTQNYPSSAFDPLGLIAIGDSAKACYRNALALGYQREADAYTVSIGTYCGSTCAVAPIKIETQDLSLVGFYFPSTTLACTVYSCVLTEIERHSMCVESSCYNDYGIIGYIKQCSKRQDVISQLCVDSCDLVLWPSCCCFSRSDTSCINNEIRFFIAL